MRNIILATMLVSAASTGAAFAGEKCNVPVAEWQPREALQAKLEAAGWKVRSVKTEDGCYETKAIDAKGNRVEAYFNPKTLDQVGANESAEGDED